MLTVNINDPWVEEHLTVAAAERHQSPEEFMRNVIAEYLEDQEDYRDAVAAMQDPSPSIPLEEVMRQYGLEH
jgi:plasmid stability protein